METKKLTTPPPKGLNIYDFDLNTKKIQNHIEELFQNHK